MRTRQQRTGPACIATALFDIVLVLVLSGAPGLARAQADETLFGRTGEIPALLARGALEARQIPNPHWRADACNACHTSPPTLRDGNVVQLCNQCHDAVFDHSYIHPVGDKASEAMRARMPDSYRAALARSGGRLSCTTCHDIPAQCLSERRRERGLNPLFFRDGPFKTRTQQCYFCHEPTQYERLNPHQQKSADGQIRAATCRLCHRENLEALQAAKSIDELRLSKQDHLDRLCTRCHTWLPHPGTGLNFGASKPVVSHLVKPPPAIATQMQHQAKKNDIILPLEPKTGRIFCATCHDPHEPGVVTNRGASAQTGTKNRLRAREMCSQCHNK